MIPFVQKYFRHIKALGAGWSQKHGRHVLLFLGMLASIALAFEGGFLIGRDRQMAPLLVEKPAESCVADVTQSPQMSSSSDSAGNAQTPADVSVAKENGSKDFKAPAEPSKATLPSASAQDSTCAFVGSRNSDKYHLPKCSWAKRIKPENRVCFTSAADAESKGYKPGCIE